MRNDQTFEDYISQQQVSERLKRALSHQHEQWVYACEGLIDEYVASGMSAAARQLLDDAIRESGAQIEAHK